MTPERALRAWSPGRRPSIGTAAGAAAILGGAAATLAWAPALTSLAPRRRPAAFPGLCGVTTAPQVALTFDDGPDTASTPAVLDLLGERGVRATFFLLGRHVEPHAEVVRRMVAEGHDIGIHGWDHWPVPVRSPWRLRAELRRSARVIDDVAGVTARWYRPPFGVSTTDSLTAARDTGLRTVLWSAWGRDWERGASPEGVVAAVQRDTRPGGTVLLHDSDRASAPGSWRVTLAATRVLLDRWEAGGIQVGSLATHGL